MRMKRRIICAATGVMMAGMLQISAWGAQWSCPYDDNTCPGEVYCEEHRQCGDNGVCIHQNCELGSDGICGTHDEDYHKGCGRSTDSRNTSHHSRSSRHCGGNSHHCR